MKTKSSFGYCLGQGFVGIKRNKMFFIASVATTAACVFMIGLFMAVLMNVVYVVNEVAESVCVTVFFDEGMADSEIEAIGEEINSWEEVSYTEFTSAEEAWANFKDEYFADNPELAEGFADDNPLANSASYAVYLTSLDYQADVVSRLESTEGVRQVNQSEITASALSDIGKIVGIVSLVLIAVLLAVSIFLIANTIITGITVRKEEIQIMKYVGATDFFVKSPFVFEGIIIGLIGAVIPLIVLYFIYRSSMEWVMEQFRTLSTAFSFLPVWDVFVYLIPVALVIGAGIGLIGSLIATTKQIKV